MDGPSRERSGVLLLRAWTETGDVADLRVRILVAEPETPTTVLAAGAGVDALCAVIRDWLDRLTAAGGPEDPAA